ncbi:MAG: TonB-dependent receptor [Balneolaceae bacterium]
MFSAGHRFLPVLLTLSTSILCNPSVCPAAQALTDETAVGVVQAVPADTLQLGEVTIRSTRIPEQILHQPVSIEILDSLQLDAWRNRSLSALLSSRSTLFVRDHGPGAMATISQRGLSPSQTLVLWEGFPINSLSLGLSDLSTLPAALFSSVEVSPGAPSSSFGGGGLGGSLYLVSDPVAVDTAVSLTAAAGSWGVQTLRGFGATKVGPWSLSLIGVYQQAENNFPYRHPVGGELLRRENNEGKASNLTAGLGYSGSGIDVQAGFWTFDQRDQLPGSVLGGSGPPANQDQYGWRGYGRLSVPFDSWRVSFHSFLEQTRFRYVENQSNIDSRFLMERRLARVELEQTGEAKLRWRGGAEYGVERVITDNYSGTPRREMAALRFQPEIHLFEQRFRLFPAARLDHYSDFGEMISFSLGLNLQLLKEQLYLRSMASRDFNPPDFNDLHWVPGGNPGLVPERSVRIEGGLVWRPSIPVLESVRWTIYKIGMTEGIYWYPGSEGVWSPENVERVNAKGVEVFSELAWEWAGTEFRAGTGGEWRRSVVASPRFAGDQAVGRQMRYVPEMTLRSHLTSTWNRVVIQADVQQTGRRYITEDHTSSLAPYLTLDLAFSFSQRAFGVDWHAGVTAQNLLDERYEVIRWYPMPGRTFEFSLAGRW